MEKPKIAGQKPVILELVVEKNMAWCACGRSSNQPWCDGSHGGTAYRPVIFKENTTKKVALCMCKQTKNPPYCDGSHNTII